MLPIGKCRIAALSEFLAEIKMTARFLAGELSAILPGFTRRLYRVNNPGVARAAAQMARKSLLHSFAIGGTALLQQGRRSHDDTGNAEPALHSSFQHKSFAQHVAHVLRKAL